MNGFEGLLDFIRHNLLQSLFFFGIAVSILRRLAKQAREDQSRRGARGTPLPPGPEDELRDKVRRGFEEMMRQRAASATAAKGPPKTVARAPSRAVLGGAPRIAPKPPPNPPRLPVTAPAMERALAIDAGVARAAAARTTALAKERLASRRSPPPIPSIARRLLNDRTSVRRAILLREILDEPRSMRTGS